MPAPTRVVLHGDFGHLMPAADNPAAGTVTVTPSTTVRDNNGNVLLVAAPHTVTLGANGVMPDVSVIATDSADITPATGLYYTIRYDITGAGRRSWRIEVPKATAGGRLDITTTTDIAAIPLTLAGYVADEGTTLTHRPVLNFTGAGIAATDDAVNNRTNIAFTGGGGGSAITVADEGTPLATEAETLDFTGAGVTASGAGATKTINVPGTPTGGAGGVLSGSYPNPGFAVDMAEQSELDAEAALARNADNLTSGTIADARIPATIARDSEVTTAVSDHAAAVDPHTGYRLESVALVNADIDPAAAIAESKLNLASDAAAGTASRRTLGSGATQAAAGNHSHASSGIGGLRDILVIPAVQIPLNQSGGSAWATAVISASMLNLQYFSGNGDQNAYVEWSLALDSGTWQLRLTHSTDPNNGQYQLSIDGTNVGSPIEGYAATGVHNVQSTITGFTIATAGFKAVRFTMATKNASSGAYRGRFIALQLQRTGA